MNWKRNNIKLLFLTVIMALIISSPLYSIYSKGRSCSPEQLFDFVEIQYDPYGVPHVSGDDEDSMYFGYGYVTARDHFENLIFNILLVSGRMAEFSGSRYIESDYFSRLLKFHDTANDMYYDIDPDAIRALENFTSGVNYYILKHPDKIPLWIQDKLAPLETVDLVALQIAANGSWSIPDGNMPLDLLSKFSNAWVVDPSKSVSGNVILVGDIHKPWTNHPEIHLNYPGYFVMGAQGAIGPVVSPSGQRKGAVGGIGVLIGSNDSLAWGVSANQPDVIDIYDEKLNPDDPHQYLYEGEWHSMQVEEIEIKVKTGKYSG